MRMFSTPFFALVVAVALAGCEVPVEPPAPPAEPEPVSEAIAQAASGPEAADPLATALAGEHRSQDNRARDMWRHPQDTLTFFGFNPSATVVEITPGGGGWYTEILAPALKGEGTLIATIIDPASVSNERARDYTSHSNDEFRAKLQAAPEIYGNVAVREFSLAEPSFGPDGSADLVLTFRNVHNWIGSGSAPAMFEGFFKVLKPGGTLGVVEHRAKPDSAAATKGNSGYMTEDAVIALATAAGFELAERSEINANPNDTADHPNGVWTLPPVLRVPEGEDAKRYKAIGESDRMTLKFVKPRGDQINRQGMDEVPENNG